MSKGRKVPPVAIGHAANLRDRLGMAAYIADPESDTPWQQLSESGREYWRRLGQAVLDAIVDKGDRRGDFSVSAIFGYDTQQPYVNIETSMSPMQCSPAKTREMALMLLEAADAAESDAVLIGYAKDVLGLDERGAAQLLSQFRQYRERTRGKAADAP